MIPPTIKYISFTLIPILLTTALYVKYHQDNQPNPYPTLQTRIKEASKVEEEAKVETIKVVSKVKALPPLTSVVSVGTTLTADMIQTLQKREATNLEAIEALTIQTQAQDTLKGLQDIQITELNHRIIFWQLIGGLLVILLVIVIL